MDTKRALSIGPDLVDGENIKNEFLTIKLESCAMSEVSNENFDAGAVKQEGPTAATFDDITIKTEPINDLQEKLLMPEVCLKQDELSIESESVDEVAAGTLQESNREKPDCATTFKKTNNFAFQCSFCPYSCKSRFYMIRHRNVHRRGKSFKCDQCDYISTKKANLRLHQFNHAEEKPFKCRLCNYTCVYERRLKQHMNCHDQFAEWYRCSVCDFSTDKKTHFERHAETHSTGVAFTCKECSYTCRTVGVLSHHLQLHSGKKYKCDLCWYCTFNRAAFTKHTTMHADSSINLNPFDMSSKNSKHYRCDKCSFADKDIKVLLIHMKTHSC